MPVLPIVEHSMDMEAIENEDDVNLLDRSAEPAECYNFGHHVKDDYQAVFIEPRHYEKTYVGRSMAPCLRQFTRGAFENVQAVLYYSLMFIFGIVLSVLWAMVFAGSDFAVVWLFQPAIKVFLQWFRLGSTLYRASMRIALDPVYESCAKMFSRIAGHFTLNLKGIPENKL